VGREERFGEDYQAGLICPGGSQIGSFFIRCNKFMTLFSSITMFASLRPRERDC
jgi:hypothetical protein